MIAAHPSEFDSPRLGPARRVSLHRRVLQRIGRASENAAFLFLLARRNSLMERPIVRGLGRIGARAVEVAVERTAAGVADETEQQVAVLVGPVVIFINRLRERLFIADSVQILLRRCREEFIDSEHPVLDYIGHIAELNATAEHVADRELCDELVAYLHTRADALQAEVQVAPPQLRPDAAAHTIEQAAFEWATDEYEEMRSDTIREIVERVGVWGGWLRPLDDVGTADETPEVGQAVEAATAQV